MKITIDENQIITGYTTVGDIEGSIEYNDKLPDDFEENFKPSFYLFVNDEIVENPDYIEPEPDLPNGPGGMQQMIMQQASTMAQMQKIIMQQSKDIAKLKGANA